MEIKITVDDARITQMVEELLAEEIMKQYGFMARNAQLGTRDGIDKAIKTYIYSRKDEIIEQCINRATAELARKGLPKLLEKVVSA